mmetsp:Transcript_39982/g.93633  ORF Transcript_39982/g.93633 Transcript_39982/m.93633 type:complete len:221 (+) Transcript_39982:214-876(+)
MYESGPFRQSYRSASTSYPAFQPDTTIALTHGPKIGAQTPLKSRYWVASNESSNVDSTPSIGGYHAGSSFSAIGSPSPSTKDPTRILALAKRPLVSTRSLPFGRDSSPLPTGLSLPPKGRLRIEQNTSSLPGEAGNQAGTHLPFVFLGHNKSTTERMGLLVSFCTMRMPLKGGMNMTGDLSTASKSTPSHPALWTNSETLGKGEGWLSCIPPPKILCRLL